MFEKHRFLTLDFLEVTTVVEYELFNCRGGVRMKTTSDVLKKTPKGAAVYVTLEDFEMVFPEGRKGNNTKEIYRRKVNISIVYHNDVGPDPTLTCD
jgi:hypothetical protein